MEKALSAIYPYMSVAFTRRRGDAAALVANALREGHHEIVAVGGDGTINEAVNGFFDMGGAISPDAVLAFVRSGAVGDFKKTFGIAENSAEAALRLKHASVRAIDVGRISYLSKDGMARTRIVANIASFGLSGKIVDSVNRAVISKLFGRPFAFAFHGVLGLLTYRGRAVRLIVDDAYDKIVTISTVAVANARSFGGGMQGTSETNPVDGFFNVVVITEAPKRRILTDMKLLTTGEYFRNPNARLIRGRKVVATPVAETRGRPVLIETDGECIGRLPATFEILPRALNVRY
jgi:diacylglycerol kinase family enzyme